MAEETIDVADAGPEALAVIDMAAVKIGVLTMIHDPGRVKNMASRVITKVTASTTGICPALTWALALACPHFQGCSNYHWK